MVRCGETYKDHNGRLITVIGLRDSLVEYVRHGEQVSRITESKWFTSEGYTLVRFKGWEVSSV